MSDVMIAGTERRLERATLTLHGSSLTGTATLVRLELTAAFDDDEHVGCAC